MLSYTQHKTNMQWDNDNYCYNIFVSPNAFLRQNCAINKNPSYTHFLIFFFYIYSQLWNIWMFDKTFMLFVIIYINLLY